ncbi:MAG: DUF4142 domain-containing protein [Candidatus Xenobia bacterium]
MKCFIPVLMAAALMLTTSVFAAPRLGKTSINQRLLSDVCQDNLMNTQIARLAQQRGTTTQVKQLASRMLKDEGRIQQQLRSQSRGMTLPIKLDSAHQALLANNGRQFSNDHLLRLMREGTAWEYGDLNRLTETSQGHALSQSVSSLGGQMRNVENLLGRTSG